MIIYYMTFLPLIFLIMLVASISSFQNDAFFLFVVIIFANSLFINAMILTLHECAHNGYSSLTSVNEKYGRFLGSVTLLPFSLYRHVHFTHHRYIGTGQDLEFWPFTDPSQEQSVRRRYLISELLLGPIVVTAVFVRAMRVGLMGRRVRAQINKDFMLTAIIQFVMAAILIYYFGLQIYLLCFVLPLFIGALMQSWRRLIEHIGLTDNSEPYKLCRTVSPSGFIMKAYCWLLLHENYHGAHHSKANIPCENLTDTHNASIAINEEYPVYTNYLQPFREFFKSWKDPKFGGKWADRHANSNSQERDHSGQPS